MFHEIGKPENVEAWFQEEVKGRGRYVMGVGHRVYKVFDPRADVLKRQAQYLCTTSLECTVFAIAERIEKLVLSDPYFIERKLLPNVDFYSSIVLDAVGIETDMQTPMFAMARVAGWTAQIIEQWNSNNRLIRPLDNYIGPMGLTWVPLDERGE
jgi:citrate synthase